MVTLESLLSNEEKIIKCLNDNLYGATVVDIAEKTNLCRNTVYRYLGILEGKDKIFKKKIGNYNLYFSKEGRRVSPNIVSAYYKGLLAAMNDAIPLNPMRWQRFGKKIADHLELPNEEKDFQKLIKLKLPLEKEGIDILNSMRPYFSLLHDKITLKNVYGTEEKKKIILHFVDSDLLEDDKTYIYHFYILSGFIEAKIKKYLGINVECDVLDYKVKAKDEENYIKISLDFL